MKKSSTSKRKVSKVIQEVDRSKDGLRLPAGPPMPVEQMRTHAKDEARRILLAECTWEMDGSGGPEWYPDGLIDWSIKLMYSAEGMPRPGGGQVYEGMDEIESDGHAEYENLRRIINRAVDRAYGTGSAILSPGAVACDFEVIDHAVETVRQKANEWLVGKPIAGTARPIMYSLAALPPGFRSKFPAWTELVRSLPDYGLPGSGQTRRAKLLQQLRRVPSFFIPEPWEARHKACVSILLDMPTTDEILAGEPRFVADIIKAEYRRIVNLTNKSQI